MAIFIGDPLNVDNVADDGTLNLDRARGIAPITIGDRTFVYVVGENDDGVTGFELDDTGNLTTVPGALVDDMTAPLDEASQVLAITINGSNFLYVGNNSADGITVFTISDTGNLSFLQSVVDSPNLEIDSIFAGLKHVRVGGTDYLLAAGFSDDGISTFRIDPNGTLTNVDNVSDADNAAFRLDAPSQIDTIKVDGKTFAIVSGQNDDGATVFEVNGNGTLTFVDDVVDDGTLRLDGALGVATVTVAGDNYVIISGEFDDGISVFSIDQFGQLTNVFNLGDSADLGINGAATLTTFTAGSLQFLVVSGFQDDALSVFRIETNGSLVEVDAVFDPDFPPLELDGTVFNSFVKLDGRTFVFGTGQNDDGISVFELGGGADNFAGGGADDTLLGFGGDDILFGNDGEDRIRGGSDNDLISGGNQSDDLNGQNGNDTVSGGGGRDLVKGGAGNDSLQGGDRDDTVDGGDGRDTLQGNAGNDSMLGGSAADKIEGAFGNDTLIGNSGADNIEGGGGSDLILGGIGDDTIEGNNGKDEILGEDGGDRIDGGGKSDELRGGKGDDRIEGARGNDTIRGGEDNDKLFGDEDNDSLRGGEGDDKIEGGSGKDTLNGGEGLDTMDGGSGADVIDYNKGDGIDRVLNFESKDRLDFTDFNFNSFNNVLSIATQVGSTVRFDFNNNDRLIINNFQLSDLNADDFFL
ncbi:MAG: beta-propeller fold lactonase family protein [Pseudomonadota bacterium]